MTVAPSTQPDLPIGRGEPPLNSQQLSGHRQQCLRDFKTDGRSLTLGGVSGLPSCRYTDLPSESSASLR